MEQNKVIEMCAASIYCKNNCSKYPQRTSCPAFYRAGDNKCTEDFVYYKKKNKQSKCKPDKKGGVRNEHNLNS